MSAPAYWIGILIIALTVLALPMPLRAIPLSPVVHETIEQQKMRLEQTQQQREALQSVEPFPKSGSTMVESLATILILKQTLRYPRRMVWFIMVKMVCILCQ